MGVISTQLEELFQVCMLACTFSDSTLIKDIEEICSFHDFEGLALSFALHILLKCYSLEKFLH